MSLVLGVVTDLDTWRIDNLPTFLDGVFKNTSRIKQVEKTFIIIVGYKKDLDKLNIERFKNGVYCIYIKENSEWGNVYQTGYKKALELGANIVLEIDMGGTHKTEEIPQVLQPLILEVDKDASFNGASFSSRNLPSAKNYYNKSRRLTSNIGTFLARHLLLGSKGAKITDLTSGFEAFSRKALENIFNNVSSEVFITPRYGPFYFWQTEIRVIALLLGTKVFEVPITYGQGIKSYPLSFNTYLKAVRGLTILFVNKLLGKYKLGK